ncbi:MAG: ArsR/SmtB family transcription factor [Halobacteriaceae archaeon]
MDSGALLDLLGNENRRRILRLLARKPCYVTEISEYIGVSPKAVIDHLRRLEEAGLVESRVDDGRRKYFRISQNLRLEVSVSPYGFGMKSAYPASASLDLNRCTHLSITSREREREPSSVAELADELHRLEEIERELSLAQRWVQGRLADVQRGLADHLDDDSGAVAADVLAAVAGGADTVAEVAETAEIPEYVVESVLGDLEAQGLLRRTSEGLALP